MEQAKVFQVDIYTSEKLFFSGMAVQLELCTDGGIIGVLKGHVPMAVLLTPGMAKLIQPQGERQARLSTGFAEILPSQVTAFVENAQWE